MDSVDLSNLISNLYKTEASEKDFDIDMEEGIDSQLMMIFVL